MITKNCEWCQKEFQVEEGRGNRKRFCCHKCQDLFAYHKNPERYKKIRENSKKYYESHKHLPEFKEKQKQKFQKWISKPENRVRFNDLLREKNRIRSKKVADERREKGVCTDCGKERESIDFTRCNFCRARSREYDRKRREHDDGTVQMPQV